MAGQVEQAAQEAPEAVEHQGIKKSSRGMIKGYYRNIGEKGK
jgi:hypothetical protein